MMSLVPRLNYGIEVIEGPPGAGKSFWAVRRMLEVLQDERRPVYTNLPLRWRVVRTWLRNRCGERVAGLIRELRKEHMDAFMKRAVDRAAFHDQRRDFTQSAVAQYDRIDREFVALNGPDVIDSSVLDSETRRPVDANWIPQAALIVLDEAHKWYPMKAQSKESPHLLDYLSMHRHMMHWIWVITQDKSNVSISFRKLYQVLVQVRNLREDNVAWSLKLKHLGIRGMGYRAYTKEQVEGRDLGEENKKPILDEYVFPSMRHNQVYFRLYSSFSQMASLREIERALARARVSCGLDEIGRQAVEQAEQQEGVSWLERLLAWV